MLLRCLAKFQIPMSRSLSEVFTIPEKDRLFPFSAILFLFLIEISAAKAEIPSFAEVKNTLVRSETHLIGRKGEVLQSIRSKMNFRQVGWVQIRDISPALIESVLLSEDRRFFSHGGVDWLALAKATGTHFLKSYSRGASTISMQLVTLLESELRRELKKKKFRKKIRQLWRVGTLENKWSKNEILEAYLNLVYFRGELQGIASASYGLFGKAPSGLQTDESVILAALIRSPQADVPRVLTRACKLRRLTESNSDCSGIEAALNETQLFPRPIRTEKSIAPHLAQFLIPRSKSPGNKKGVAVESDLYTTLDSKIQSQVLDVLRRQVLNLKDRNMNDAAALVVENQSGRVLAYVGSVGELSVTPAVDGVQALRQAGSTLKPFLYALAISSRYLTLGSRLDDSNLNIPLDDFGSVYNPSDFDHSYHGTDITLRTALASSLNLPAVRTLQLVGVSRFVRLLNQLGFNHLNSEEYYGPSLALGAADVSLWELVNAYRTLANGGKRAPLIVEATPSMSLRESYKKESMRVFDRDTAFLISDTLADPVSRSLAFGMSNVMNLRFWSASKTGTSKDMRDNWCVGFSSRYTVGVWTGNFSGQPMWNVSGVSGAAPAWAEILTFLHDYERIKPQKPAVPKNLIRWENEWYLEGTEPLEFRHLQSQKNRVALPQMLQPQPVDDRAGGNLELPSVQKARILYPVDGLVVAFDPDIPKDHQRIYFESSGRLQDQRWQLNHAVTSKNYLQVETAGNHTLQLIDRNSNVLDEVRFSIRN